MNLALQHSRVSVGTGLQYQPTANIVNQLQKQNQKLSDEVMQKNENMAILEQEKANLIREIIQLQEKNRNKSPENIF